MGTISDKLTYLNTTKTKIREGLNSLGADLDTEDTFRSYADAIDEIYENYPKITGEGTDLSLDNTKQASMEIDYKGNTSQVSYSGKSIIDLATYSSKDSNVTLSFIDNNLLVSMSSGSYGKVIYDVTNLFKANQGKKINIRYYSIDLTSYTGTSSNTLIQIKRNSTNTTLLNAELTKTIYTIPSDITDSDVFQIAIFGSGSSSNASSVTYNKLMFYFGEESASFEPYVGGTASPNPSYPQPINVVSGDNTINICGKNLFDKNNTTIEIGTISAMGAFGYSTERLRAYWIEVDENTQYTLSTSSSDLQFVPYFYNSSKTFLSYNSGWKNFPYTLTTPSNTKYIAILFKNSTNVPSVSMIGNLQLEKGSTATTYEPYIGNTYPIYLGVENLFNDTLELGGINNSTGANSSSTTTIRNVNYIDVKPNTTYTISTNAQGVNSQVALRFYNSSNTYLSAGDTKKSPNTFTTPTNCFKLRIVVTGDTDTNTYVQLEKGSKVNHPSTTPIELCKIGNYQDYFGKSDGRNLCNVTFELGGIDTTTGQNGSGTDRVRTKDYVEVKPNTTYTLSGVQGSRVVCFYNSSKAYLSYAVVGSQATSGTFTTPNNTAYIRWYIIQTNTNIYEMLNEGSTALPYEPYGKVWYLHKEIGKVVLNGSENWTYQSQYPRFILTNLSPKPINNSGVYSTHYIKGQTSDTNNVCSVASGSTYSQLLVHDERFTTKETYNDWLLNNNTEVYYVLAIPTNTPITDTTLINQLEESKLSYISQTNISQVNNDLPFKLDVKALRGE